MRLMAQRVGPNGRVTGIDVDAPLGEQALSMPHGAGQPQCAFHPVDLTRDGAPFRLVCARLLLYHLRGASRCCGRLCDSVRTHHLARHARAENPTSAAPAPTRCLHIAPDL
jgi:hypothetical protein